MKNEDVKNLYSKYVLPTYKQYPVCLVKGKGSRVWDIQEKEYIDFFPGWAVSGIGHCHPMVVNAVKNQARKILHIPNHLLNLQQGKLAQQIIEHSFPGQVFFCNSGAEAAESAVKYARRFGNKTGRYEIITMKKSFHGRTMAALAATGQGKTQAGYDPLLEGFRYAEFNNLESVKKLITEKTIGIFLEPVLGEGGIEVAEKDFMAGLRELCNQRNLLLILDEVQTGMGRTGKMFGFQHYGIEPDIMTLAKSLGGGVPIGALVVHEKVNNDIFIPGSHGSTFGGNPLACAAALAVFNAIKKEKLLTNVEAMGGFLEEQLLKLKRKFSFIRNVRGLGLMRGLELEIPGTAFVDAAVQKGLLINCTQDTILRIMPAMTITKKRLRQGIAILDEVFHETAVKV